MFIEFHTRHFDDTTDRIKKIISVLNNHWFYEKKRKFDKLREKGEDYFIIDHTPVGYEKYLEELHPEDADGSYLHFIEAIYFDKYCFYSNYSSDIVTGENVMNEILTALKDIIADAGISDDYDSIIKVIADVKKWIAEAVEERIEQANDKEFTNLVREIVRKINWKIDYSFNNKLRALELVQFYKNPSITVNSKSVLPECIFESEGLDEIFYKNAIPKFLEIERELTLNEWFTDKKWNDDKNVLVSLILILQTRGYLKNIKGKSKNANRLAFRRFFEKRYSVKINKQMQPAQIKLFGLPKVHEPKFDFIDKHS
jgi:hypothetical protein